MHPRLTDVLTRARAAITGTAPTITTRTNPGMVAAISRPTAPPVPSVRVSVPPPQPATPSRPSCEPGGKLRAGLTISAGAVRLHQQLHRLAVDVMHERGYQAVPDSLTFHLPAVLVAGLVGYTPRHLYRLADELQHAGLIQSGGHAQSVAGRALWDGTLWSVKLTLTATPPRIRADEWRHQWRPNFQADYHGKRGAGRLMSHLQSQQLREGEIYTHVLRVAVDPDSVFQPVASRSDMESDAVPVGEILYTLGDLVGVHPAVRQRLITRNARALAGALNDPQSVAFYAGLMHQAVNAEHRGVRGLSALQHALQRVLIDVREWGGLRSPGALLLTRLRAAGVTDALHAV